MDDRDYLFKAIENAKASVEQGGFPSGAVIVRDGEIIGEGVSLGNVLNDPTSHGEVSAIREACTNLATSNLVGSVLYSSMQPCVMCLGAIAWCGITEVVFASGRDLVSEEYYAGHHDLYEIASGFINPIDLKQIEELEQESLAVVQEWEQALDQII